MSEPGKWLRFTVVTGLVLILIVSGLSSGTIQEGNTDDTSMSLRLRFDLATNDTSQYNHPVSINGFTVPEYTPAIRNQGIVLDGTDDYLEIPDHNSLDATAALAEMAWVYPTNLGAGSNVFVISKSSSYALLIQSDGTVNFGLSGPTGGDLLSLSKLKNNVWYFIAGTYDGTTARVYINGTVDRERATTGAIAATMNAVQIGKQGGGMAFFSRVLDEVRIYNASLTPQEVSNIYTFERGDILYGKDDGRQSALLQVWDAVNQTGTGDINAARDILWNEANQSQARQTNFWAYYNATEAAHLAETLKARDILWSELNQSSSRQSVYWNDYNITEAEQIAFLQGMEARINASHAAQMVTVTTTATSTVTATTTVAAPATTTFYNDTRNWHSHVVSSNLTTDITLANRSFLLQTPHNFTVINRTAILEANIEVAIAEPPSTSQSYWHITIDGQHVNNCIYSTSQESLVGLVVQTNTMLWNMLCLIPWNITDGTHFIAASRISGTLVSSTGEIHAILRVSDKILFPNEGSLFVQPVLTPILVTVPSFVTVNFTSFVPVPSATFITVTEFIGNASEIVEAQSLRLIGLNSESSWTFLLFLGLTFFFMWQEKKMPVIGAVLGLLIILSNSYWEAAIPFDWVFAFMILLIFLLIDWIRHGWKDRKEKKEKADFAT